MIVMSLAFMILALLSIYFYPGSMMVLGISLYKFFLSFLWPSLLVFTNESYDTRLRSMGIGSLQAISKIASIFTPTIAFVLFTTDPSYPFIFLCSVLTVALLVGITFTGDKTQQPLDHEDDDDIIVH